MDDETRAIYEERAADWVSKRRPVHLETAQALAARSSGPSIDLGCGPGWYSSALPAPTVALDAAKAMLDLVPTYAGTSLRVQADLESLPFRAGAFGTAWARNSYVHLPRTSVPLAMADLHRALSEDARATIALFLGDDEGHDVFDDEFAGRYFSRWDLDHLRDVMAGAGFELEDVDVRTKDAKEAEVRLDVRRARTLPDIVGPDMRMLVCGLNPSLYSAGAGIGFARPGNRFWPAALAAGVVSVARDTRHALQHHGVGFTDLVKRATVASAELSKDEYRAGLARVERLAAWLEPGVIAFVGLEGWRAAVDRRAVAGPQERTIGGRPVYVMPSSSGLNTRSTVDTLAQHLRAAAALA